MPRHSHQQGRTDRTKDRVEKRPRQHSCPQHTISLNPRHVPTIHILFDQKQKQYLVLVLAFSNGHTIPYVFPCFPNHLTRLPTDTNSPRDIFLTLFKTKV